MKPLATESTVGRGGAARRRAPSKYLFVEMDDTIQALFACHGLVAVFYSQHGQSMLQTVPEHVSLTVCLSRCRCVVEND